METTINKSRLMSRAWYLVKNQGYSLSWAMTKVWKEMKEYIAEKLLEIESNKLPEYQGSTYTPDLYDYYHNAPRGTYFGD